MYFCLINSRRYKSELITMWFSGANTKLTLCHRSGLKLQMLNRQPHFSSATLTCADLVLHIKHTNLIQGAVFQLLQPADHSCTLQAALQPPFSPAPFLVLSLRCLCYFVPDVSVLPFASTYVHECGGPNTKTHNVNVWRWNNCYEWFLPTSQLYNHHFFTFQPITSPRLSAQCLPADLSTYFLTFLDSFFFTSQIWNPTKETFTLETVKITKA